MSNSAYSQHWHALALAYLDDRLTSDDRLALRELASDPQFHRCLAEHALDAAMLYRLARQGTLVSAENSAADEPSPQPADTEILSLPVAAGPHRPRVRPWLVATSLAGAALAAAIAWWRILSPAPDINAGDGRIASITQTSGNVTIRSADGERAATIDDLMPGDVLTTENVSSSAIVRLPDGTRISLSGNTTVSLRHRDQHDRDKGKQIVVDSGQITARVLPQAIPAPLWVNTQSAEVQAAGTDFQLSADGGVTRLDVSEGKLLLTRLSDRQSLELASGQYAVAGDDSAELVACGISPVADSYEVDFEAGLPPGWRSGELTREQLPAGSRGGVRAAQPRVARYGNEGHFAILSTNAWAEGQSGLFAIHDDSYLNFTYSLGQPEWFHIMIGTRGEGLPCQNFESRKRHEWWRVAPGQWQTLSVPLRNFGRNLKGAGAIDHNVTPAGRVAYYVLVSSQTSDREMVIDRLWVTRGLPVEATGPTARLLKDGSVLTPLPSE